MILSSVNSSFIWKLNCIMAVTRGIKSVDVLKTGKTVKYAYRQMTSTLSIYGGEVRAKWATVTSISLFVYFYLGSIFLYISYFSTKLSLFCNLFFSVFLCLLFCLFSFFFSSFFLPLSSYFDPYLLSFHHLPFIFHYFFFVSSLRYKSFGSRKSVDRLIFNCI